MSGGSWNYAYQQVMEFANQLKDGEENDSYRYEEDSEFGEYLGFRKHPLRMLFSEHMLEVAEVMRCIEWSDSGDKLPDGWIEPCENFLRRMGYTMPDDEAVVKANGED